ncbi:hypothetical protein [Aquitalea sp. ASV15]|nr:hypothetical protein [Aquitalea sp. ASV15]
MLYLRLMLKGFLLAVLLVLLGFGYMAWGIALSLIHISEPTRH